MLTPIFSVKTLAARHATMMQEAIDACQSNARTRLLDSSTGADLLGLAREALKERNRYPWAVAFAGRNGADANMSGIYTRADCTAVPNSYPAPAEGTWASLTLKRDETGEERWEYYCQRGHARQIPYGDTARTFAAIYMPIGKADDPERTRAARDQLASRGWSSSHAQMRKYL